MLQQYFIFWTVRCDLIKSAIKPQFDVFPFSAPDPPVIGTLNAGYDYVNVSWTPSDKTGDEKNPGSEFYIKYRKTG